MISMTRHKCEDNHDSTFIKVFVTWNHVKLLALLQVVKFLNYVASLDCEIHTFLLGNTDRDIKICFVIRVLSALVDVTQLSGRVWVIGWLL